MADRFAILTDVFLRLIKMIVAPLVFSTLMSGLSGMSGGRDIGRIGPRSIAWFVCASLLSLFLGLLFANIFQPGAGLHMTAGATTVNTGLNTAGLNVRDVVTHIIPTSLLDAMARNDIIEIVVFSLFFGLGLNALKGHRPVAGHGTHHDERHWKQHRDCRGGASRTAAEGRRRRRAWCRRCGARHVLIRGSERRDRIPAPVPPKNMKVLRTTTAAGGIVGILGGMGPLATVDFMSKLLAATPAASDQEHVPVVISSIPQVPDRTRAFRGEGESPLPAMVDSARRLKAAGAGLVVIACNTAHLWYDELSDAIDLPMIHLVDAAIEDAAAIAGPGGRVGLLGTDATLASGLYINRSHPAASPIRWLLPTAREMTELVMPGIEAVKAGNLEMGRPLLAAAAEALKVRGATAVILGCTEIPVVLDAATAPLPVVDATAALARRAVDWSRQRRNAD